MYPMIEHPDIESALRTGYPSWIHNRDFDVDDDEEYDFDEDVLYQERREDDLW